MIVYFANTTLDPCGSQRRFTNLRDARDFAGDVGHYAVYEYRVIPCIPGKRPERRVFLANHYATQDGWVRDAQAVSA